VNGPRSRAKASADIGELSGQGCRRPTQEQRKQLTTLPLPIPPSIDLGAPRGSAGSARQGGSRKSRPRARLIVRGVLHDIKCLGASTRDRCLCFRTVTRLRFAWSKGETAPGPALDAVYDELRAWREDILLRRAARTSICARNRSLVHTKPT